MINLYLFIFDLIMLGFTDHVIWKYAAFLHIALFGMQLLIRMKD